MSARASTSATTRSSGRVPTPVSRARSRRCTAPSTWARLSCISRAMRVRSLSTARCRAPSRIWALLSAMPARLASVREEAAVALGEVGSARAGHPQLAEVAGPTRHLVGRGVRPLRLGRQVDRVDGRALGVRQRCGEPERDHGRTVGATRGCLRAELVTDGLARLRRDRDECGIRTEQRGSVPHDGIEHGQRRFLVRGPQEDVVEGVALDLAAVEVAHRAGQLDGAGDLAAEARQRSAADPVGDVGVDRVPERQPSDHRGAVRQGNLERGGTVVDAAVPRGEGARLSIPLRQAGRLDEPDAGLVSARRAQQCLQRTVDDRRDGRATLDRSRDGVRGGEVTVLAEHLAVDVVDEPEHEGPEADDADQHDGQAGDVPRLEDARGPHASLLELPADHLQDDGEPDRQQDADRPQSAVDEPASGRGDDRRLAARTHTRVMGGRTRSRGTPRTSGLARGDLSAPSPAPARRCVDA